MVPSVATELTAPSTSSTMHCSLPTFLAATSMHSGIFTEYLVIDINRSKHENVSLCQVFHIPFLAAGASSSQMLLLMWSHHHHTRNVASGGKMKPQ